MVADRKRASITYVPSEQPAIWVRQANRKAHPEPALWIVTGHRDYQMLTFLNREGGYGDLLADFHPDGESQLRQGTNGRPFLTVGGSVGEAGPPTPEKGGSECI